METSSIFILSLIVVLQLVPFSEGRQLKEKSHMITNHGQMQAPHHTLSSTPDDFSPTNPGRSPGVGHKAMGIISSTKDNKQVDQTPNSRSPAPAPAPAQTLTTTTPDEFTPTNPGRSPGVGHNAIGTNTANNNNKKIQTPYMHLSSSSDDFASTNLGRSPGIGHKDIGINTASNNNKKIQTPYNMHRSSNSDDFVSTNLGRSPGIGHKDIGGTSHVVPEAHTVLSSSSPDDFKPTNPGRSPGVGHSIHENHEKHAK